MIIMRGLFERFGGWVKAHRFLLVVVFCCVVIVAAGVVSTLVLVGAANRTVGEGPEVDPAPEIEPEVRYFSRLTGFLAADKAALSSAATCVMIENSPAARPQSGLRNAGVVYEATAEGGITRFMAVFQAQDLPALIGPVRSVRLHYAEWAKKYQCAIAHWGGADDALSLIRNGANGFRDADQFFNPSAYWRLAGRAAPHNGYTSAERQAALNVSRGFTVSEFVGFPRAVGGVLPMRSAVVANAVHITISSALYNVNYAYDVASNSYLRSHVSGGAHMDKDADGATVQNAPKVVVALMSREVGRAGGYYTNVETVGTGKAHIFQNGEYIEGSWTKSSVDSELEFYDAAGNPVVFVPGQVWISAVAGNKPVTWE